MWVRLNEVHTILHGRQVKTTTVLMLNSDDGKKKWMQFGQKAPGWPKGCCHQKQLVTIKYKPLKYGLQCHLFYKISYEITLSDNFPISLDITVSL